MAQEGRPENPVPLIDAQRCDGCGLCVQVCPNGVLAVQDGLARIIRPDACTYTGLCEMACPPRAINRPFWVVIREDEPEAEH